MSESDLTTAQVARALGMTTGAVRQAFVRGILVSRLEETGRGPLRLVAPAEVERYRAEHLGKRGRPTKDEAASGRAE